MQQFSSKKSCEMIISRLRVRTMYYAQEIHTIWKVCRRRGSALVLPTAWLDCRASTPTSKSIMWKNCNSEQGQEPGRGSYKQEMNHPTKSESSGRVQDQKPSFQKIRITIAGPEAKCLSQAFAKSLLKGRIILLCSSLLGTNSAFFNLHYLQR